MDASHREQTGGLQVVHQKTKAVEADILRASDHAAVWAEFAANPVLSLRAGYIHRIDDRDEFVEQNEYMGNAMTLGIGLTPLGTRWMAQAGFMMEWLRSDFGDPDRGRGGRQQASLRVSWRI